LGLSAFEQQNQLGRINAVYATPYGNHHDIEPTKRGTFLVTGTYQSYGGAFIYEIEKMDGRIVNGLVLEDVFQKDRFVPETRSGSSEKDWFHLNSVDDQGDGTIILSGRNQSVVAKLEWPSGSLRWILADPANWDAEHTPYLLTPTEPNFIWPNMQHAPVALPDQDGDPDTVDVLVFDNGAMRSEDDAALYTRLVILRVNEKAMTVHTVWEYTGAPDEKLFSRIRGNVQRLENGNFLGTYPVEYDAAPNEPVTLRELTEDGETVWECKLRLPDGFDDLRLVVCQSMRLPLYRPGMENIRLGAHPYNLVPGEVYKMVGLEKPTYNALREITMYGTSEHR
jgi:hypothetical protein